MWHNMLLATEVDQALNYANDALYTLQSGSTTKIVLILGGITIRDATKTSSWN